MCICICKIACPRLLCRRTDAPERAYGQVCEYVSVCMFTLAEEVDAHKKSEGQKQRGDRQGHRERASEAEGERGNLDQRSKAQRIMPNVDPLE